MVAGGRGVAGTGAGAFGVMVGTSESPVASSGTLVGGVALGGGDGVGLAAGTGVGRGGGGLTSSGACICPMRIANC